MSQDDETSKVIEFTGTAQGPRIFPPWAKNPDGPRSEAEAVDLAKRWGVLIPEDIRFIFRDNLVKEKGAYAAYNHFESNKDVRWFRDFYVHGKIPVKIRPSVLNSDEAIVAVIAHEMFELNALREMFETRETISGAEIIALVRPERPGNLHDHAWDAADALVRAMREERDVNV